MKSYLPYSKISNPNSCMLLGGCDALTILERSALFMDKDKIFWLSTRSA